MKIIKLQSVPRYLAKHGAVLLSQYQSNQRHMTAHRLSDGRVLVDVQDTGSGRWQRVGSQREFELAYPSLCQPCPL